jgi:hypothetical protein
VKIQRQSSRTHTDRLYDMGMRHITKREIRILNTSFSFSVIFLLVATSACSDFMYRPTMDDFHKSHIFQIMDYRTEARRRFEDGSISENKIDKPIWAFQKTAEDSHRGEGASWYIDSFSHGSYSPWGVIPPLLMGLTCRITRPFSVS